MNIPDITQMSSKIATILNFNIKNTNIQWEERRIDLNFIYDNI